MHVTQELPIHTVSKVIKLCHYNSGYAGPQRRVPFVRSSDCFKQKDNIKSSQKLRKHMTEISVSNA